MDASDPTPEASAAAPAGTPAVGPGAGVVRLVGAGLGVLVAALFVQHAFVCDDAYVTYRVLDNFVGGYGLRWNVHERVQAYTHPLWLFVSLPAFEIVREPFKAAIATSLLVNLVLGALLWRQARDRLAAFCLAVVVPLVLSRSFLDYACSGLENPLTHVLLVGFWLLLRRAGPCDQGRLLRLTLLAALGAVNRLDTVLLFGPGLLYAYCSPRPWSLRRVGVVLLGSLPLCAWLLWSLFYYGFALPNTYYAKLQTGIAAGDLWRQGLAYLLDLASRDPFGAVLVVAGGLGAGQALLRAAHARYRGLTEADGRARLGTLMAGGLLYSLYVISVGGDFMAGRLWTPAILVGALALQEVVARVLRAGPRGRYCAAAAAFLAAAWSIYAGTPALRRVPVWAESGIVDERVYYEETNSLRGYLRGGGPEQHRFAVNGAGAREEARRAGHRTAYMVTAIGMAGYYAGPDVMLLDQLALTDPLLARLPVPYPKWWRIGHFGREFPVGYLDAQASGDLRGMHPELAAYFRALRLVVAGDLCDGARLRAVWDFNLGRYEGHRRRYLASPRSP